MRLGRPKRLNERNNTAKLMCKPALACHENLQLMHVSANRTVNREVVMPSSLDATWTVKCTNVTTT